MSTIQSGVVVPGEDAPELAEAARLLREHEGRSAHLVLGDGTVVPLPDLVTQAIQHLVRYLAAGDDVTIAPNRRDYSLLEAAHALGVSRYYVEQLVENGEIPAQQVGASSRIAFADLVAQKAKIRAMRAEGVRLIQQISEEEGAYDG